MVTEFKDLIGKTLSEVHRDGSERIEFTTTEGKKYALYHSQDCCESVTINDICGDLQDLVGSPIVQAEETTSNEDPADYPKREYPPDSLTWTFYRFATAKGAVVIRWIGESNGYYSESVTFAELN